MTLLIDNDIVHKLAQLDLLDSAVPILLEKYESLVILNTLRYKFCPPNEQRRTKMVTRYTSPVIDRIEAFINSDKVSELDCEITDLVLIEAMANSDGGLDAGEMQLLQALVDSDGSVMFTGDKRFLKAIGVSEEILTYADKLNQSFVCFEQIIIFLIKSIGFDVVKGKFLLALEAGLKVDSTLNMCFEGQQEAIEERVMNNLDKFVGYIKAEAVELTLLSNSPEWMIEHADLVAIQVVSPPQLI